MPANLNCCRVNFQQLDAATGDIEWGARLIPSVLSATGQSLVPWQMQAIPGTGDWIVMMANSTATPVFVCIDSTGTIVWQSNLFGSSQTLSNGVLLGRAMAVSANTVIGITSSSPNSLIEGFQTSNGASTYVNHTLPAGFSGYCLGQFGNEFSFMYDSTRHYATYNFDTNVRTNGPSVSSFLHTPWWPLACNPANGNFICCTSPGVNNTGELVSSTTYANITTQNGWPLVNGNMRAGSWGTNYFCTHYYRSNTTPAAQRITIYDGSSLAVHFDVANPFSTFPNAVLLGNTIVTDTAMDAADNVYITGPTTVNTVTGQIYQCAKLQTNGTLVWTSGRVGDENSTVDTEARSIAYNATSGKVLIGGVIVM